MTVMLFKRLDISLILVRLYPWIEMSMKWSYGLLIGKNTKIHWKILLSYKAMTQVIVYQKIYIHLAESMQMKAYMILLTTWELLMKIETHLCILWEIPWVLRSQIDLIWIILFRWITYKKILSIWIEFL